MKVIKKVAIGLFCVLASAFIYAQKTLAPVNLRCDLLEHTDQVFVNGKLSHIALTDIDNLIEPVQLATINSKQPTFSWALQNDPIGGMQTAYQIQVATSVAALQNNTANMWDSQQQLAKTAMAKYAGQPLDVHTTYFWRVRVWTNTTEASEWSQIKGFRTGSELKAYDSAQYPLVTTTQTPVAEKQINESLRFYDFGKAAFGRIEVTIDSKKINDSLTVAFGEVLNAENRLEAEPGGSRRYRSVTIPLKQGVYTYSINIEKDPRNTRPEAVLMPAYIGDVYPFRYCEIQGSSSIVHIERIMATYVFNEYSSHFESSNSLLNDIWEFCKYSIKATSFTGAYVDGDRERIPYEADAYINQLSHYGVDNEYTMSRKSQEYMLFNATWPTEWILTSVLMAYQDYMYTGNSDFLEHYYDELQKKSLTMLADKDGLISTRTGKLTKEVHQAVHYNDENKSLRDIVDWPHKGILGLSDDDTGETDGFVFTDYNAVVNAYYNASLQAMAQIAKVVGNTEDSENYSNLAKAHKKAFNDNFLDKERGRYRDGISTDHSALHSNMFALAFDLVPRKYVEKVTAYTKSRKMACSVYGSQHLLDAVYAGEDAAYGLELLTSKSDRGWAHAIYDVGTTISMEAWDNKYKPNQDWNHAWGAAPANIIPRRVMGIEPLKAGFEEIRIKPQIGNLEWASIKHPTIKGTIAVDIRNDASEGLAMSVVVPANTISEIWVPAKKNEKVLRMNNKRVKAARIRNFLVVKNVRPGTYKFTLK
ncbi:alpha-L-rhamnosidase C-terminal domain-containing protein [Maribacter sp. LLG6340-A2]|uniref:alpha-L-rhamnosidase-related protein n=1 Tax=Maribacter sp. LLG6340-A2 TaxID=3160834 RepID=UPI0038651743